MREEEVLDELLRDGARTLFDRARLQVDERRARDALEVEAVVAVEAPVLDGDDGLLQRLRRVLQLDVVRVVHVDAALDRAPQEDDAAQAVREARVVHLVRHLIGRHALRRPRQEGARALPRLRGEDGEPARQEVGGEEQDDEEKKKADQPFRRPPSSRCHEKHSFACNPIIRPLPRICHRQISSWFRRGKKR